jgi:hypothetical protein
VISPLRRLENALVDAVAEHGEPNSFSPGELSAHYGAGLPMRLGRLGRRHFSTWRTVRTSIEGQSYTSVSVYYNPSSRLFEVYG